MDSIDTNARANKRRRTDDIACPTVADISVWNLLADEHVMAIFSWCAPADLGRLSVVDWRLRRLAFDERLWKRIYEMTFPPCGARCIATLCKSVAGLDIAALVDRGLDRLLHPTNTTEGCVLPLSDSVRKLGAIARPTLSGCHHHWPDVISVRGYRWAYAVATVHRPRFFGPHLDGSPACLVGRTLNNDHRGDLIVGERRDVYVAHGYATVDATTFLPSGTIYNTIRAQGVSGQWTRGYPDGHAVAWCGLAYDSDDDDMCLRDRCVGFYQGHWAQGRPHRVGTLIGPDYNGGRPKCGGPLVVRHGPWHHGVPGRGTRAWSVVTQKNRPSAGMGIADTSVAPSAVGIVRAIDGRVAFIGNFSHGKPAVGLLMDRDGKVVYRGDVHTIHATRKGRLFLLDGRTVDFGEWKSEPTKNPPSRDDRDGPRLTVTYSNGDRLHCRGVAAQLIGFVCADGRTYRPPLGWDAAPCCLVYTESTQDLAARLLLQNTPFALAPEHPILSAHKHIPDGVFWPRIASPDEAIAYSGFLDHMALRHGSLWLRCRTAVRLLWGLDDIPATPSPQH
ncbi:F-box domain protein [Pandoravirus inopinatum]|uniref:F-box domain protein n=1 Tax=Pandoravirus inopinatum TaxID=1605721 RepID=A0A0B5JDD1_9VIRU|nr:F-box domain protein [Pandoravirus inopinatum]AJF97677.1 F-box domain protein [Pandoravirus inopinatum]